MSQLVSIRTRLRQRLGNPDTGSVADTELDVAINLAYVEILDEYNFHANRKKHVFTTISDVAEYPLSSDIEVVRTVRNDTTKRRLRPTSDEFRAALLDQYQYAGEPLWFYRTLDKIEFIPTPDDTYSMEIIARTEVPELVNDAQELLTPRPWDLGVILLSRHHFYDGRQDYAKAQYARNAFDRWVGKKPSEYDDEGARFDQGVRIPTLNEWRGKTRTQNFDRDP